MKKFEIKDLADFKFFVQQEILPLLKAQTVFLLSGEVGAGKTELVKTIAEILKLEDVQSPTFAFHNSYQGEKITLHHVDLYRLQDEDDLESTGFWDLFENENDTIFVEWSNLILDHSWPWGWSQYFIEIKKTGEDSREIVIKQPQG